MSGSTQLHVYLARVEQARAEGEAATLAHVRERCQRSEEAWAQIADRAARAEQTRANDAKRKAEQKPPE